MKTALRMRRMPCVGVSLTSRLIGALGGFALATSLAAVSVSASWAWVTDPSDMADSSGDIRAISAQVQGENLLLTMSVYGSAAPSVAACAGCESGSRTSCQKMPKAKNRSTRTTPLCQRCARLTRRVRITNSNTLRSSNTPMVNCLITITAELCSWPACAHQSMAATRVNISTLKIKKARFILGFH